MDRALSPIRIIILSSLFFTLGACQPSPKHENISAQEAASTTGSVKPASLSIPFEKYQLENGLDVIFHIDKSDPVVAINLAAHVGSARELPGRTGFAHLFEHLLFLDSENLGYGGLDAMNTRIGGEGTNGFTTNDMTQYFQAVPKDALEKVIWAEADKLGYFIKTVTKPALDNEKQVVKNEKRQSYDNQPYGYTNYIIGKTLYPPDHPYHWQVIGSLADVDAATLSDVQSFYKRWYVPNNVTVTISGDFEPAQAKIWMEKYFGEIPRGEDITPLTPRPAILKENINLYHEDNFATVPRLTMVWPGIPQYHKDSAALDILLTYLSNGKRAPFNEVLIDEEKLTSSVSTYSSNMELAGEIYLSITANAGDDLDGLVPAINRAFSRFEENGISQADLDRIKAGLEIGFYGQLQSVLGKAIQLSEYNLFTDDPSYLTKDIEALLNVSTQDVMRVYETYIKNKPILTTSFVPTGASNLALDGAQLAQITQEAIVPDAPTQEDFDPKARTFEPTASKFDRTIEPPFGDSYTLPSPEIWRENTPETIQLFGIENNETPLVYFSLFIDAGRERVSVEKPAVANLTAAMLKKGTATKTTAELEDAIQSLGSSISVFANTTGTYITGSTLNRNFTSTMALVEEILLEPRWDEQEYETLIRAINNSIDQSAASPRAIASREASKLRYDENHILHYQAYGTKEKLAKTTLADLKAFYNSQYTPKNAKLRIAGAISHSQAIEVFKPIETRWNKNKPGADKLPVALPQAKAIETSKIYFYDVPDAKQSILSISHPSVSAIDPDYPLLRAVNFLLGNIYTSRLNTALRVEKGYTYGINSGFYGGKDRGTFAINSSVRSNVTLEAMALIRDIVSTYGPDFTEEDLTLMKQALLRGQALDSETLSSKLSIVGQVSAYGFPDNYRTLNAERIAAMSLEDFKALAKMNLRTDAMNWLVVGDAATQLDRLEDLGFGKPVLLEANQE